MEGARLPFQEQLHNLGTAVQCWGKNGKKQENWIVCGIVLLHTQGAECFGMREGDPKGFNGIFLVGLKKKKGFSCSVPWGNVRERCGMGIAWL